MEKRIAHSIRTGALFATIAMLAGCATESYGFRDGTRGSVTYVQTSPSYHRDWDHGSYHYQPPTVSFRNHPDYSRDADRRDRDDRDSDRDDHHGWDND